MTDEAALLHRYAETRAEDAFAELVRRHVDAVYSAALRRVAGDTHLAEDITQQVFVALARRAGVVARHPALIGWLHIATRHEAANAVRAERRRKAREQEALTMHESANEPGDSADWGRIAPLIDSEIDRLDERDRVAVLLRFIDNRSFADIGATLQVSADAARMRVDRALNKLRVSLSRRGLASTSAALAVALTNHAVASAPFAVTESTLAAALLPVAPVAGFTTSLLAMTSTKSAAVIAVAVLLGALGTATYEVQRAARTSTQVAQARERQRALESQLHKREAQLATLLDARRAAALAGVSPAHSNQGGATRASVTSGPGNVAAVPAWDAQKEGRTLMEKHPAIRQAYVDMWNASTNFRFSGFYEIAGLNPAQIAEFQRLQRESASWSTAVGPDLKEFRLSDSSGAPFDQNEAAMHSLLGEQHYREYLDYSKQLPAREMTARLASALTFSEQPLTQDQFQAFVQTITETGAIAMTQTGPRTDWSKIESKARSILTSAQLPGLQAVRARTEYNEVYSETMAGTR